MCRSSLLFGRFSVRIAEGKPGILTQVFLSFFFLHLFSHMLVEFEGAFLLILSNSCYFFRRYIVSIPKASLINLQNKFRILRPDLCMSQTYVVIICVYIAADRSLLTSSTEKLFLCNCIKQNEYWETYSRSVGEEISRIFGNWNFIAVFRGAPDWTTSWVSLFF
jgi:hypothetical protein